ncbi:hypothetical protein GJ744_010731 [Endocarpon pusillum]|uniref:Grh/CP2 DB domain-containing protein n=1 Tax=Endocarpon pusillum TaxID=364733 RepID=A0A8H7E2S8_9EURO|nr:hypothetical protein GJ744_010731 [Endocarpon pusillum]
MFRNRTNSQKPDEEFYAAFKQNFPGVGPGSPSAGPGPAQRSSSLSDVLTDANLPNRHFGDQGEHRDHDATPKGMQDHWRFTPSVMDPNSFAFSTFANQPPGYYTPTPGGLNTLYHSQAGDLHTPGMGNLNIPLHHYQPHLLQPPQFENVPNYAPHQVFAPSSFLQHKDSGYEAMTQSPHDSPAKAEMGMLPIGTNMSMGQTANSGMAVSGPMGDNFRYHVTLNAPTAMVKHSDEIPISYLNKGQAYSLSVIDTLPPVSSASPIRYRTFVRVSFEDDEQRAKPGACWQLWKEGRGTSEAHQREGKLLAVEHVDTNQGGDEESRKPQIELLNNSFDGFCVTWAPNPVSGRSECSISVRFNFLSTDFSHSKGVKGIPVRLCAKTEKIQPEFSNTAPENQAEVCYAKVKLFRDHGAERKLANDVAHVKKTIEKLKQQISQAESGIPTFGKRKRSGSMAKQAGKGPGKVVKHKRTWSIDSDGEAPTPPTQEEDLVMKLTTMQDMFSSTQPVSVLDLRGDKEDDPDLFPVQFPGGPQDTASLTRQGTWESKPSAASTPTNSNAMSPTSSSNAVVSPHLAQSTFQPPLPLPPSDPAGFSQRGSIDAAFSQTSTSQSPSQTVPLQKSGISGNVIDVFGVDIDYQAPPERPIKPVACFYVRRKDSKDLYYRAVYLMQRTVKDLINAISEKFQVDPTAVTRVTHLNSKGLHIIVDEDVVRELPEEQDMIVEFSKVHHEQAIKSEARDMSETGIMVDGDVAALDSMYTDGLEMWLNY